MYSFSAPLLSELHLLSRDGKPNQDTRRKLKQVEHLMTQLLPLLAGEDNPTLVDVGSGKSYLGFLLADARREQTGETRVFSIESRGDLVRASRDTADRFGFSAMRFFEAQAAQLTSEQRAEIGTPTLVSALHACDTATDEAIELGVMLGSRSIAVVPCCQAEVSRLLSAQPKSEVSLLWRHGLHGREFASVLTNAVRATLLETRGYRVRVIEFTGWEHTGKSELILAERVLLSGTDLEARERITQKRAELNALVQRFGLSEMSLLKKLFYQDPS